MRLSELCNEGYSGVLILCDVYDFEDNEGNLIYSGKLGPWGESAYLKFFHENRDREIIWMRKHPDEYKSLRIVIA